MSFFTVSKDQDAIKDNGSGMFFPKSDIYKVTIETIRVQVNNYNARHLHLKFKNGSGKTQYLFGGIKLEQNNGQPHFQHALFNKLCIIAGIDNVDNPTTESRMWLDAAAKGDTLQDIDVLDQFDDMEVYVKIDIVYSIYNNEIRQGYDIKNFYRWGDKATADEIVNGREAGVQYAKDLPLCADVYRDGLTIEDVDSWKANGFGKGAKQVSEPVKNTASNPFA